MQYLLNAVGTAAQRPHRMRAGAASPAYQPGAANRPGRPRADTPEVLPAGPGPEPCCALSARAAAASPAVATAAACWPLARCLTCPLARLRWSRLLRFCGQWASGVRHYSPSLFDSS